MVEKFQPAASPHSPLIAHKKSQHALTLTQSQTLKSPLRIAGGLLLDRRLGLLQEPIAAITAIYQGAREFA
jgi:hypothetical protein